MTETVHLCPKGCDSNTRCCNRIVFELPLTDRMTVHPDLVTCQAKDED